MVVVGGLTTLLWFTTVALMYFAQGSLAWSSSICDLKACSCHAGGPGRLACDCRQTGLQELILQKSGPGYIPNTISTITIENCDSVHILENAFSQLTGLQTINLYSIDNLDLDEHSFYWNNIGDELRLHPGIKINIIDTYIEELPSYTFRGMIHTILLKNCTIEDIQVFSFASLINTERIEIVDTKIDNIQSQSFKKFSLNTFMIYNSKLPILPTRSMIDLEVTSELRFERVEFDVIRSSSISAHGMQILRLLNNKINRLEKESLMISTKGSVIFQNNMINDAMADSIKGITVDERYLKEEGTQDFTFMNNSITTFENHPFTFNTTQFAPRIESFNVLKQCTCNDIKSWLTKSLIIMFVASDNKNNIKDNKNAIKAEMLQQIPEISSLINCKINKELITIKQFEKSNCFETSYKKYVMVTMTTVITVFIVLGIIYLILRNRMKRYINVPTSNGDNKLTYKGNSSTRNPIMVVPEGKTYRETELHVIVEQAEPIVEHNPRLKYEN